LSPANDLAKVFLRVPLDGTLRALLPETYRLVNNTNRLHTSVAIADRLGWAQITP
jgi:hypothetical protein